MLTLQTFDVDEEELPAYPPIQSGAKSAAIGSRSSYTRRDDEGSFGGEEVEDTRPQRKPKPATAPKKKKSTTRTADGTATEVGCSQSCEDFFNTISSCQLNLLFSIVFHI